MERSVLAKRLPDIVIAEIINNDLIPKAYPVHENEVMKILSKIWYKYVEPSEENIDCNICKSRILNCFKSVKKELELINYEYNRQLSKHN